MIKNYLLIAFIFISIGEGVYIYVNKCDCPEVSKSLEIKDIEDKIYSRKENISTGKEVIKTKERTIKQRQDADTIEVRLNFDSTATKDTIYIELVKCDSIGKERLETIGELEELHSINAMVISELESVVALHEQKDSLQDKGYKALKKEARKQKRKAVIRLIGGGITVVGGVIVAFNPVTGLAVLAVGGTILVVSAIKK